MNYSSKKALHKLVFPWVVQLYFDCTCIILHKIKQIATLAPYEYLRNPVQLSKVFLSLFADSSISNGSAHSRDSGIVEGEEPTRPLSIKPPRPIRQDSYAVPSPYSLRLHCKENPIYVFLFWELRGLSPNFHIHTCLWAIYIFSGSGHIVPCSITGRLILEIYKSLSQIYEFRNWETEHYNSVLILGIHKWEPDIYIGFSLALQLQCVLLL